MRVIFPVLAGMIYVIIYVIAIPIFMVKYLYVRL